MARSLRVEYPGAYYHVINRGNAGENIFHNIRDREKFLEYAVSRVIFFGGVSGAAITVRYNKVAEHRTIGGR